MPAYEIFFTVKRLAKPQLVSCLKRVGEFLLDNDGVLRKVEYIGTKQFPYKLHKLGSRAPGLEASGSFFLYHCDLPYAKEKKVLDSLKLDYDLIKIAIFKKNSQLPEDYECTLAEELLPPSYRKSVQSLIEHGRKKKNAMDLGKDAERW